jgi:hypothetical protein
MYDQSTFDVSLHQTRIRQPYARIFRLDYRPFLTSGAKAHQRQQC